MTFTKLDFPDLEREALIAAFAKLIRATTKPVTLEITIGEGPGLCREGATWSIATSQPGEPQARRRRARPPEPRS